MTKEAITSPCETRAKIILTLPKNTIRELLQVYTGHGMLAYHARKRGACDTDICPHCKLAVETPQHFMQDCPNFFRSRISCFGSYTIDLETWTKTERILSVCKYLSLTRRFKQQVSMGGVIGDQGSL